MSSTVAKNADPRAAVADQDDRYLTVLLGDEQFALPILHIREIIGMMAVTPVPGSPVHVRGVINLRGKIIPVTDLRRRLGLAESAEQVRGCIVVAELAREGRTIEMGLIVDAVSEVLTIAAADLQPAPAIAGANHASFIRGMARSESDDRVRILLDVGRVVDNSNLAA